MARLDREKELGRYSDNSDAADSSQSRKVFVRGLAEKTTQEEFEAYFNKFGHVTDAVIMVEKATQKPRGFGFVTFETESIAEAVIRERHVLSGSDVTCEKAVPKKPKEPDYRFREYDRPHIYDDRGGYGPSGGYGDPYQRGPPQRGFGSRGSGYRGGRGGRSGYRTYTPPQGQRDPYYDHRGSGGYRE